MATPTKLIVLLAFTHDEEGGLQPDFEPREMQSEDRARHEARMMAATGKYAGNADQTRGAMCLQSGLRHSQKAPWGGGPTEMLTARIPLPQMPQ